MYIIVKQVALIYPNTFDINSIVKSEDSSELVDILSQESKQVKQLVTVQKRPCQPLN